MFCTCSCFRARFRPAAVCSAVVAGLFHCLELVWNERHPLLVSGTGTCCCHGCPRGQQKDRVLWVATFCSSTSPVTTSLFFLLFPPATSPPQSHSPPAADPHRLLPSSLFIHAALLFFVSCCPPHWSCALSFPDTRSNPPACPHLQHCCFHSLIYPLQSQTRYSTFILFLPLHCAGNCRARILPCSCTPRGSLLPTAALRQLLQSCCFSCLTHTSGYSTLCQHELCDGLQNTPQQTQCHF